MRHLVVKFQVRGAMLTLAKRMTMVILVVVGVIITYTIRIPILVSVVEVKETKFAVEVTEVALEEGIKAVTKLQNITNHKMFLSNRIDDAMIFQIQLRKTLLRSQLVADKEAERERIVKKAQITSTSHANSTWVAREKIANSSIKHNRVSLLFMRGFIQLNHHLQYHILSIILGHQLNLRIIRLDFHLVPQ